MYEITFRTMLPADYAQADSLWQETEGMGLHEKEDSEEGISLFLERNRGLSFVAEAEGKIVGTILTGTDGRRGSFNHLAVSSAFRKRGIATKLVELSLEALRKEGINRCYAYVYKSNKSGVDFWRKLKWQTRQDLEMFGNPTDSCGC